MARILSRHDPEVVLDLRKVKHIILLDIFILQNELASKTVVNDYRVKLLFVDLLVEINVLNDWHVLVVFDQLLHADVRVSRHDDFPLGIRVSNIDGDDVFVLVSMVVKILDASCTV